MKTLDEKVAEKMGWEWKRVRTYGYPTNDDIHGYGWAWTNGKENFGEVKYTSEANGPPPSYPLPPFSTDWNATKIVIKFMRERGYSYCVYDDYVAGIDRIFFYWGNPKEPIQGYAIAAEVEITVEIIDDDLLLAACEAFLQIDLEGK